MQFSPNCEPPRPWPGKPDGIEPFWFISKFDDLQFVEKDNSLFHAGDKSTIMITEEELKIVMEETGGPNRFITLVQMDGEKHAAYRELTQSWFGPRSLRELEPRYVNARKMLSPACWPKRMLAISPPISRFIIRCA